MSALNAGSYLTDAFDQVAPVPPAYTYPGTQPTLEAKPLGYDTDELDLDEEAIAEQSFLRSFGLGSWMTYQPKRFSIAKIVA